MLADEAAYNANRVYFVPPYWRTTSLVSLILDTEVSLDDAIEQVKEIIK